MSSLHPTRVRPVRDDPVYTAMTVSWLEPIESAVLVPLVLGAYVYHTVAPIVPHGRGSPVSRVAPLVLFEFVYGTDVMPTALEKQLPVGPAHPAGALTFRFNVPVAPL